MDPKTVNHLQVAARNRELARALLAPPLSGLQPAPWEWVAVIAFYAAVHCVHAYLWETTRQDPRDHRQRHIRVHTDPRLARGRSGYGALSHAGRLARYDETYTLTEREARTFLEVHFRRVEATVMQALGQPVPAW